MRKLTLWTIDHPRWTLVLSAVITLGFLAPFPRVVVDTDPENVLEPDQPDRVFYDRVKEDFGVDDLIVVGIIDGQGIFRPRTLTRLARIADGILEIEGVIADDVMSLSTTDDLSSGAGGLRVDRIMPEPPETAAATWRYGRPT